MSKHWSSEREQLTSTASVSVSEVRRELSFISKNLNNPNQNQIFCDAERKEKKDGEFSPPTLDTGIF